MSNYTGTTPDHINGSIPDRFFYGLRRTDAGELFVAKMDQMSTTDGVTINKPGDPTKNYPSFEQGQDFYEGRDVNHDIVYENLNYEQMRWDDRNISYYVNSEGELIARVNQKHVYDDNSSSNGL